MLLNFIHWIIKAREILSKVKELMLCGYISFLFHTIEYICWLMISWLDLPLHWLRNSVHDMKFTFTIHYLEVTVCSKLNYIMKHHFSTFFLHLFLLKPKMFWVSAWFSRVDTCMIQGLVWIFLVIGSLSYKHTKTHTCMHLCLSLTF